MGLFRNYIGERQKFPLNQRIFHAVCLILILSTLSGGIVNLFLNVPIILTILTFAFVILPVGLLHMSRFMNRYRLAYNILLFVSYVFVIVIWRYNAGLDGYIHLILFAMIIWQMVFSDSKDIFWFVLNVLIALALAFSDVFFPEWIVWRHTTLEEKVMDYVFTYLIMGVSTYFIVRSLVFGYRREKTATELVLKQLVDLNQELKSTVTKLENSDQTKSKLFSVIAHDIRSFSGNILSFSDILYRKLENKVDPKLYNYMHHLHDSSRKMNDVLQNLLSWSRLQMNEIKVYPKDVNFHRLVTSEIRLYSYLIENKNLAIELQVAENDHLFVDEDLLTSIMRNLLANAIKFSNENGTIVIAFSADDEIVIAVSDNGIGMSREQLSALTGGGTYQSTPGTKREKGTGLGFKIIQEFARLNMGRIEVESEPGKGSTFKLVFPSV